MTKPRKETFVSYLEKNHVISYNRLLARIADALDYWNIIYRQRPSQFCKISVIVTNCETDGSLTPFG